MSSTVVVKLGGSAITDKSKICTPRLDLIHRVAGEIAAHPKQLILLHGGGSYAHPFATRDLMARGFKGKSRLESVSEIELNLDQLTRIIGVALLLRGRPFVPMRPMSFMTLQNGNVYASFLRPLTAALRLGIIPIIHGDLCVDEKKGFGVVSADRIASLLGEKMAISRVLFGCDVDGVYGTDGQTILKEVSKNNHTHVLNRLNRSTSDATGGMRGKVVEAIRLARFGVESYIFNLNYSGNLTRLLNGDSSVGTRLVPWK
jgi:isopentenyl phosphate kinase